MTTSVQSLGKHKKKKNNQNFYFSFSDHVPGRCVHSADMEKGL